MSLRGGANEKKITRTRGMPDKARGQQAPDRFRSAAIVVDRAAVAAEAPGTITEFALDWPGGVRHSTHELAAYENNGGGFWVTGLVAFTRNAARIVNARRTSEAAMIKRETEDDDIDDFLNEIITHRRNCARLFEFPAWT
jgi:hypothetical protein